MTCGGFFLHKPLYHTAPTGFSFFKGSTLTPVPKVHRWQSQVRDYEVDMYGGVNAATYLNYLEEARKGYLAQYDFNLKEMFDRDLGFIVTRYEIDYKLSLVAGDEFVIRTSMERVSRLKVRFFQQISRLADPPQLAVECTNYGIPIRVSTNKPIWPVELDEKLKAFQIPSKDQPPRCSAGESSLQV